MKIHLFFFILLFGVTILPAVSVYFQYRKTFLIFRPWYYRQIMSLVGFSDHMNVECNNLYMSYIFHEIFPLKDYLFTSARKKFPQYGSVDMRRECVKGNGRCKNQCHASEVRIAYCMRPGSLCCLQK